MGNSKASFSLKCIVESVDQLLEIDAIPIFDFLENHKDLDDKAGVYVFWWVGDDARFRDNAKNGYHLKGPHNFKENHQELIKVDIDDEWINHETYEGRICLYVGKTTQLHTRIKNHVKLTTENIWMKKDKKTLKVDREFSFRKKPNTVSQLRIGVERLFQQHSVELIQKHVQVSYLKLEGNEHAINRFFIEDRTIGQLFPLFNMDVER